MRACVLAFARARARVCVRVCLLVRVCACVRVRVRVRVRACVSISRGCWQRTARGESHELIARKEPFPLALIDTLCAHLLSNKLLIWCVPRHPFFPYTGRATPKSGTAEKAVIIRN